MGSSIPASALPDVFDWEGTHDVAKGYGVDAPGHAIPVTQMREELQAAGRRMAQGSVRDAVAILRRLRPQLGPHTALHPSYAECVANARRLRQAMVESANELVEDGDVSALKRLLDGKASETLEHEEVARLALAAAQRQLDARDPASALDILRVGAFRVQRDKEAAAERDRLEARAYKMRHWFHFLGSAAVMGTISLVAGVLLFGWAVFVWNQAEEGQGLKVPIMIVAAVALIVIPRLGPLLERKLGADADPRDLLRWIRRRLGRRQRH